MKTKRREPVAVQEKMMAVEERSSWHKGIYNGQVRRELCMEGFI